MDITVVQLPDYLPNKYKSWLDLYQDVVLRFKEWNLEINDSTTVDLFEAGFYDEKAGDLLRSESGEEIHFYHSFPITLIKARALDYVLGNFPNDFKQMQYILMSAKMQMNYIDEGLHKAMENLFNLNFDINGDQV